MPSGSYTYVWDITTYGNSQHFTKTGNPVSLVVGPNTGDIRLLAKAYLNGVHVGSLQPKVVGNNMGGCGGRKC